MRHKNSSIVRQDFSIIWDYLATVERTWSKDRAVTSPQQPYLVQLIIVGLGQTHNSVGSALDRARERASPAPIRFLEWRT
jgi:hypothetical protein